MMNHKTYQQDGTESPQIPGVPTLESRRLADELSKPELSTFHYDDLSAAINMDVRTIARGYLMTAREIVLREKGFVFRALRNVGLRRLTNDEVAALDDRFQHVRRTHKKTLKELGTVDITTLSDVQRVSCVAKAALAHMTVHTHAPRQMRRIESAVGKQHELSLAKTLEAFRGGEPKEQSGNL